MCLIRRLRLRLRLRLRIPADNITTRRLSLAYLLTMLTSIVRTRHLVAGCCTASTKVSPPVQHHLGPHIQVGYAAGVAADCDEKNTFQTQSHIV